MNMVGECGGKELMEVPVFEDVVNRLSLLSERMEALNEEVDNKLSGCLGEDFTPRNDKEVSTRIGGSSLKDMLNGLLFRANQNVSDYERLVRNLRKLI